MVFTIDRSARACVHCTVALLPPREELIFKSALPKRQTLPREKERMGEYEKPLENETRTERNLQEKEIVVSYPEPSRVKKKDGFSPIMCSIDRALANKNACRFSVGRLSHSER